MENFELLLSLLSIKELYCIISHYERDLRMNLFTIELTIAFMPLLCSLNGLFCDRMDSSNIEYTEGIANW